MGRVINYTQYEWYKDGAFFSGGCCISVSPTSTTTYTVIATLGTSCIATDSVTVSLCNGTCGYVNGHVFEDVDGNGIKDVGENGLPGITVVLNPGGINGCYKPGWRLFF